MTQRALTPLHSDACQLGAWSRPVSMLVNPPSDVTDAGAVTRQAEDTTLDGVPPAVQWLVGAAVALLICAYFVVV